MTKEEAIEVRKFEGIEVTYPPEDICTYPEYKGKPYFGIRYKENGESIVGYGTYNPQVLSRYLKDYFMPTTNNDIRDNRVKNELNRVKDELEPTTKNDLPHCQHTDEEIAKSFIEDVEAVKDQLHTKNDLGVDCISRKSVITIIQNHWWNCRDIDKLVNDLPSVTPQEPRKGHWIYDYTSADGHRTYHCSECGCYLQPKHSEPLNSFKWCSLCGADMREVKE